MNFIKSLAFPYMEDIYPSLSAQIRADREGFIWTNGLAYYRRITSDEDEKFYDVGTRMRVVSSSLGTIQ